MELPHRLERSVTIGAPRALVFAYFTDGARWAAWWGAGSTIDARRGGCVSIRYPDGTEVSGEVLDVSPPEHIVFTYGYVSGTPIPAGASRVTIRLAAASGGTRVEVVHEFADPAVRDQHVQGWRYQLSLFANVVMNERHRGAAASVDAWFAAWSEPDGTARRAALDRIATPAVALRDRFSAIDGLDELTEHMGAALRFMPGLTLRREGDVRHCQGTLLADWTAVGSGDQPRGRGTTVFMLASDGRIASATGFWLP